MTVLIRVEDSPREGEAGRVYFYQNELPYDVNQVERLGGRRLSYKNRRVPENFCLLQQVLNMAVGKETTSYFLSKSFPMLCLDVGPPSDPTSEHLNHVRPKSLNANLEAHRGRITIHSIDL